MPNTELKNSGCVGVNSQVLLHYRLSLRDGQVVDTTFDGEPLLVLLGQNELLASVESRLLGAHVGDEIRVELTPLDAFGMSSAQRVYRLPRERFATEWELKPDSVVNFTLPNGEEVAGSVIGSDGEWVTIDFNHPLAGQHVIYEFRILKIG